MVQKQESGLMTWEQAKKKSGLHGHDGKIWSIAAPQDRNESDAQWFFTPNKHVSAYEENDALWDYGAQLKAEKVQRAASQAGGRSPRTDRVGARARSNVQYDDWGLPIEQPKGGIMRRVSGLASKAFGRKI